MFERGDRVRLIHSPLETGTFIELLNGAGIDFAKVQFQSIRRIPLDQLEIVPLAMEEPIDLLRGGRLGNLRHLRQVLLHTRLTGRLADILYSMEASNTEFHAHQFKPVLKMLGSPTDGILIADEVGLGKTIEAGLIWTELRARYDYSRLIVICPKVLCQKWVAELTGKFAIDARSLGAAELIDLLQQPEKAARGFAVVCGIQSLQPPRGWEDSGSEVWKRASSRLSRFFRDQAEENPLFDLCIIDEAHHLRNAGTQRHLLAKLVRPLTRHRVFLSATPIQLRARDLFSLLTLLDPDTFRVENDFTEILSANEPLIRARDAVQVRAERAELLQALEEASQHHLLKDSLQLGELKEEIRGLPDDMTAADRSRIAGRLERVNLLANIINRTRRRDVEELRVERRVFAVIKPMTLTEQKVYQALTDVVREHAWRRDVSEAFLLTMPQRMLTSCIPAAVAHWKSKKPDFEFEDEGDDDWEESDDSNVSTLVSRLSSVCQTLPSAEVLAAEDSKFSGLIVELRKYFSENPDEKIVIFSTFRGTLQYLQRKLSLDGIQAAIIHGGVQDRDDVLVKFANDRSVRVLLSSEVGSEGIDLQFCRTVINYDMPWNPMRVEQRIGRVDRLGQKSQTISVINLLSEGTIDERIYSRLYQRLEVCQKAIGDFEAALGDVMRELTVELLRGGLDDKEEAAFFDRKTQVIANNQRIVAELEAEALSLIAHGDHVLRSIHDARDLSRWITSQDLATYIGDSVETLFSGCRIKELEQPGLYEMTLSSEARLQFVDWLSAKRLSRGSRLEREAGPVICRLGGASFSDNRRRSVENIGQMHPFVKFLTDKISDSKASTLRPAVAVRVPAAELLRPLPPGKYVIAAELWRFESQITLERLVYAGFNISDGFQIEDDDAESLANIAAASGRSWPTADLDLDCAAIAVMCEKMTGSVLLERYSNELSARSAEQVDRVEIQTRNLHRRFELEERRLIETIDRQRRSDRVKGSIVLANEGKLRNLRERKHQREQKIEASRKLRCFQESLFILAVEVTS